MSLLPGNLTLHARSFAVTIIPCDWIRHLKCSELVEGVGFEPTKLSQRIYSPPQLATLVPLRMKLAV